jgi:ribosomal protein S18 acetylase RimI-like enzyme
VRIRGFAPADTRALYEICLLTGNSGQDATGLFRDPELIGEVYVGPYVALEPELAFVGVDDEGVAGYVIGALDTERFEERCEREWWPPLRERYPLGSFPDGPPDGTRDARLVGLIHKPPRRLADVAERYPAHLHIDLLPRVQGGGNGRRLMTTLLDALADAGAPGVHLGVGMANERAIGFYHHLGFTEVVRYTDSLVLARRL